MITSNHNPKLQMLRKLLSKRSEREQSGLVVLEGVRLAEEAVAAHWQASLVLASPDLSERGQKAVQNFQQNGADVETIAPDLLKSLSDTENSQGLLAVVQRPRPVLPQTLDFIVIADTIRDPGNLGTLLRSAAAAGAQAVLVTPTTTDPFSPKVLRSGMGAHFRLPILETSWEAMRAICQGKLQVLLAEAEQGLSCWESDLRRPTALLIGGEADGASPEGRQLANGAITIPMPGQSESLNAAIAASILLFEVVRQRRRLPAS
jgi:TrmH family RNA methyltransferase